MADRSSLHSQYPGGLVLNRSQVNDVVKQDGSTKDMIFSVPALVSHCSSIFSMEPGDLILTGTPAGVGPVRRGDTLQAGLNDSVTVLFNVE